MEGHCKNPWTSVYRSLDASSLASTDGVLCQLTLNDEPSLPSSCHLTLPPAFPLSFPLSFPLQSDDLEDLSNFALTSPSSKTCMNMCSVSLPSFSPIYMPNFYWNNLDGASFCSQIRTCYDEVAYWKRNLFQILFGKANEALVKELVRLFQTYADFSSLETGPLYTAMTMPPLLLQRPPGKKKRPKDLFKHLECRLSVWMDGDLESLLIEGCTI